MALAIFFSKKGCVTIKTNFIVAAIFTCISLLLFIPTYLLDNINWVAYAGMTSSIVIYFACPIFGVIIKKKIPLLIVLLIYIQTFLCLPFTTAFGMYDKMSFWDIILHGLLGIELLVFGYFMLINCGGEKLNWLGRIVFLMMFVLGCSAIWEICEYIGYNITKHDFQHMYDIKKGDTPLDDTMTDVIVAMITATISYIAMIIDYALGSKLLGRITKILKIEGEKNNEL